LRLLLTDWAARTYGPTLQSDFGDVLLVEMAADGTLAIAEEPLDWETADVEVAWATADLFNPNGALGKFFGFARRSDSLRWFQSAAAGFDAPIFAELVRRGVALTSSDANSVTIAEYVLRAVLERFQESGQWAEAQRAGRWERHDFRDVAGSSWLIVGLGSIGCEVAVRARAFGARVVGVRRHLRGDEPVDEVVTPDRLADVVGVADVVVLCAPANASSRHIVDAAFLDRMKDTALLVNVGRGSLVDEDALVAALDAGSIGAAALDVFDTEPLPAGHPLWSHPRVSITPHNSPAGDGRDARAAAFFFENLARYRRGERLVRLVTEADLDPA
jgi:phosphoglycerate dehydrogenase-like enzyme